MAVKPLFAPRSGWLVRLGLCLIVATVATRIVWVQAPVEITGSIVDASGAVLPGVTIALMRGSQTVLTTVTAADGSFRMRLDRKSTRLNSSHIQKSRMPSSA